MAVFDSVCNKFGLISQIAEIIALNLFARTINVRDLILKEFSFVYSFDARKTRTKFLVSITFNRITQKINFGTESYRITSRLTLSSCRDIRCNYTICETVYRLWKEHTQKSVMIKHIDMSSVKTYWWIKVHFEKMVQCVPKCGTRCPEQDMGRNVTVSNGFGPLVTRCPYH